MKKFFGEFKKFITRGNVVDMAVGVIVGSSFTAIVNGLSNFVLKPIINWVLYLAFGKDSLSEIYTFLVKADENGVVIPNDSPIPPDLKQSIYIDWGSFINAIINFFLVAFVLFMIVRFINKVREGNKKLKEGVRLGKPTPEERKEMKALGIKRSDKEAVAAYYADKAKKEEEARAAQEEKARLDRLANPTVEDLLKQIRDLMQEKA